MYEGVDEGLVLISISNGITLEGNRLNSIGFGHGHNNVVPDNIRVDDFHLGLTYDYGSDIDEKQSKVDF